MNKSNTIIRKSINQEIKRNNFVKRKTKKENDIIKKLTIKASNPNIYIDYLISDIQKDKSSNETEKVLTKKNLKHAIFSLINHKAFLLISTIIVLIALFANDFKYVFFHADTDSVFDGIYIFILIIFMVETIISVFIIDYYIFGFYFWIDIISTMSMILEMDIVLKPIVSSFTFLSSSEGENDNNLFQYSKASNARVVIVITVLRIIRLARIIKIYKNYRIYEIQKSIEQKVIQMKNKKRTEEERKSKLKNECKSIL